MPRPSNLPPLTRTERLRAAKASRERSDGRGLMSVAQAADYLGVNVTLVYRLIKAGDLRSTKVGSVLRLRPSDLDDFIDRNIAS
jgi:excisionase family DNA binding protein